MSFVEGLNAASVDVSDPAFVLCLGGVALLLGLLLAVPALATALSLLRSQGVLGRLFGHFMHHRRGGK